MFSRAQAWKSRQAHRVRQKRERGGEKSKEKMWVRSRDRDVTRVAFR